MEAKMREKVKIEVEEQGFMFNGACL